MKVDKMSTLGYYYFKGCTDMHVISVKPFQEAAEKYPNQSLAIMDAYRVLRKADFKSPEEMRKVFPSLDNFKYEDKWWIVDIGGNKLRLMAFIQFMHDIPVANDF